MRVVKITALWCSACLIMNKRWNNILKNRDIETLSLDLDMNEEEAKKYNPGNILPIFIFYKGDKEIKRLSGELSEEELLKVIEEVGE